MPDGLPYPDQILYLSLRMLYDQYKKGIVGRDMAAREKRKLLAEHECLKYRERMGEHWVELIKRTDIARCEYRKNRTLENADKLIRAIDGGE